MIHCIVLLGLIFISRFEAGAKFEYMYPLEYMLSMENTANKDQSLSNIIHLITVDNSLLSHARDFRNDDSYSKVVSLLQNSIKQWSFIESQLLEPNANLGMPELYTPLRHLTTTLEVLANVHYLRQEYDYACLHLERACPLMELLPAAAFASLEAAEESSQGCFMLLREVYTKLSEMSAGFVNGIDDVCRNCGWNELERPPSVGIRHGTGPIVAELDIEARLEDLRRPYVSLREELWSTRSSWVHSNEALGATNSFIFGPGLLSSSRASRRARPRHRSKASEANDGCDLGLDERCQDSGDVAEKDSGDGLVFDKQKPGLKTGWLADSEEAADMAWDSDYEEREDEGDDAGADTEDSSAILEDSAPHTTRHSRTGRNLAITGRTTRAQPDRPRKLNRVPKALESSSDSVGQKPSRLPPGDTGADDEHGHLSDRLERGAGALNAEDSDERRPSDIVCRAPVDSPFREWDGDCEVLAGEGADDWDGVDASEEEENNCVVENDDEEEDPFGIFSEHHVLNGMIQLVNEFVVEDVDGKRRLAEEAQALLDDQTSRDTEGSEWMTSVIRAYVRLLWRCVQDGMSFVEQELVEAEEDASTNDEDYEQAWLFALRVFSTALSQPYVISQLRHRIHDDFYGSSKELYTALLKRPPVTTSEQHTPVSNPSQQSRSNHGHDKEASAAMYESPAGTIFGHAAGTPPRAAVPTVRGDALSLFAALATVLSLVFFASLILVRPGKTRKPRPRTHRKPFSLIQKISLLLSPSSGEEEPLELFDAVKKLARTYYEKLVSWIKEFTFKLNSSSVRPNSNGTSRHQSQSGNNPKRIQPRSLSARLNTGAALVSPTLSTVSNPNQIPVAVATPSAVVQNSRNRSTSNPPIATAHATVTRPPASFAHVVAVNTSARASSDGTSQEKHSEPRDNNLSNTSNGADVAVTISEATGSKERSKRGDTHAASVVDSRLEVLKESRKGHGAQLSSTLLVDSEGENTRDTVLRETLVREVSCIGNEHLDSGVTESECSDVDENSRSISENAAIESIDTLEPNDRHRESDFPETTAENMPLLAQNDSGSLLSVPYLSLPWNSGSAKSFVSGKISARRNDASKQYSSDVREPAAAYASAEHEQNMSEPYSNPTWAGIVQGSGRHKNGTNVREDNRIRTVVVAGAREVASEGDLSQINSLKNAAASSTESAALPLSLRSNSWTPFSEIPIGLGLENDGYARGDVKIPVEESESIFLSSLRHNLSSGWDTGVPPNASFGLLGHYEPIPELPPSTTVTANESSANTVTADLTHPQGYKSGSKYDYTADYPSETIMASISNMGAPISRGNLSLYDASLLDQQLPVTAPPFSYADISSSLDLPFETRPGRINASDDPRIGLASTANVDQETMFMWNGRWDPSILDFGISPSSEETLDNYLPRNSLSASMTSEMVSTHLGADRSSTKLYFLPQLDSANENPISDSSADAVQAPLAGFVGGKHGVDGQQPVMRAVTVSFTLMCLAATAEDVHSIIVYINNENSQIDDVRTVPCTRVSLRRSLANPKLWGGTTRLPAVVLSAHTLHYRYALRDRNQQTWWENCPPRSMNRIYDDVRVISPLGAYNVLELEDYYIEKGVKCFD